MKASLHSTSCKLQHVTVGSTSKHIRGIFPIFSSAVSTELFVMVNTNKLFAFEVASESDRYLLEHCIACGKQSWAYGYIVFYFHNAFWDSPIKRHSYVKTTTQVYNVLESQRLYCCIFFPIFLYLVIANDFKLFHGWGWK